MLSCVITYIIVQDDPLCVTARKDCKIVVTGLWVDHSFDAGTPVDPTTVRFSLLCNMVLCFHSDKGF